MDRSTQKICNYIPLLTHRIEHIDVPNDMYVHPYNMIYAKKNRSKERALNHTPYGASVFDKLLRRQETHENRKYDYEVDIQNIDILSDDAERTSRGYSEVVPKKVLDRLSEEERRIKRGYEKVRQSGRVFGSALEKASIKLSKLEEIQREVDEKKREKEKEVDKQKDEKERVKANSEVSVLKAITINPATSVRMEGSARLQSSKESPQKSGAGVKKSSGIVIDVGRIINRKQEGEDARPSHNFMNTANESMEMKSFEDSLLEDIQTRIKNLEDQLYKNLANKRGLDE